MKNLNISILCTILSLLLIFSLCSNPQKSQVDVDRIRSYANALYNRELHTQAIREYQRYLDQFPVSKKQRANINFIIGNIYFDRLHDYENAMSYYLKVKYLFPESELIESVNKKIVECLERLQRTADAKQAMDETIRLDSHAEKGSRPGEVIARIGERKITSGDLKYYISRLPEYLQSQFKDRKSKIEFLKNYIATELFYDAAKRKGLDRDKDVIEGTFQAKKQLMVQKYLEQEISPELKITPDEVELYYKANREKYVEKDEKGKIKRQKPFSEVREDVVRDLMKEKQKNALERLLERMMNAENVKIYEDLIK